MGRGWGWAWMTHVLQGSANTQHLVLLHATPGQPRARGSPWCQNAGRGHMSIKLAPGWEVSNTCSFLPCAEHLQQDSSWMLRAHH